MGTGIILCGLNGAGKSTLGKALAEKLGFSFIDNEDLYFHRAAPCSPYSSPRPREAVEKRLLREIKAHENFVFTAVKGDYGEAVSSCFQAVILVEAPKALRLRRVKSRSFEKFGARMLPGGDLWAQEQAFFELVSARADDLVEEWVQTLHRPVLRVDGTRPVEENTALLVQQLQRLFPAAGPSPCAGG